VVCKGTILLQSLWLGFYASLIFCRGIAKDQIEEACYTAQWPPVTALRKLFFWFLCQVLDEHNGATPVSTYTDDRERIINMLTGFAQFVH
jgi:hypothetical protein